MTVDAERERVSDLLAHTDPLAPQSDEIEQIVTRAADIAGVPMATLNLLDDAQQHQAATVGFEGASSPRADAMCDLTLRLGTRVYTEDASADERFAGSPWVDGRLGNVRFYASLPLVSRRRHVLGTLCTFDIEPHALSAEQLDRLAELADEVVRTFEHERSLG